MHSEYRELNTKYLRTCKDYEDAVKSNTSLTEKIKIKVEENTSLSQDLINEKSRMSSNIEKIQTLQRELGIKS